MGGFIPLQETIWGSYFGRRYLGAVRSVAMPFALVLGAGGPLAASFYVDVAGSYQGVLAGVALLWLLGGGLMLLITRPHHPHVSPAVGGGPGMGAPESVATRAGWRP